MDTGKFSLIAALAATVACAPSVAQNPAAPPAAVATPPAAVATPPVAVATPPAAVATPPAPPAEIEVGRIAPDFTIQVADSAGIRAEPVRLSSLRGKVVVLAFYPADRSSGCTHQLTKFRDEYAKMFGPGTVVLPISVDSASTHASWAAEMKFPFGLGVDSDLRLAKQYGSWTPGRTTSGRTVFVIGKDGTILWRNLRFPALSENAYTELAAEVAKAQ